MDTEAMPRDEDWVVAGEAADVSGIAMTLEFNLTDDEGLPDDDAPPLAAKALLTDGARTRAARAPKSSSSRPRTRRRAR